jgi:hypothetical protein
VVARHVPPRSQLPVDTIPGLGTPDIRGQLGVGALLTTEDESLKKTSVVKLSPDGKNRYSGYRGHTDRWELFHLEEDPYELRNLFSEDINTASQMKEELLEAINAANRNFQKK